MTREYMQFGKPSLQILHRGASQSSFLCSIRGARKLNAEYFGGLSISCFVEYVESDRKASILWRRPVVEG